MPKVKSQYTKRDPLLELLLGRQKTMGVSNDELAEKLGVCTVTLINKRKAGSDSFTLGQIKTMCRALEITADELRANIKMI